MTTAGRVRNGIRRRRGLILVTVIRRRRRPATAGRAGRRPTCSHRSENMAIFPGKVRGHAPLRGRQEGGSARINRWDGSRDNASIMTSLILSVKSLVQEFAHEDYIGTA